jgi:branched-chain amino acid transport system substrate-binding protein
MMTMVRGLGVMAVAIALVQALPAAAEKRYGPGVSDTEIRIGNTMPYSGGASIYGAIGKAESAYFRMVNDQSGVNGRKITFVSLDDGYSPPRTLEQTRQLVEQENVLLIFGAFGTATISATQKYLNEHKVPQLFLVSGASKWNDPEQFPWIRGWQPTYQMEGQIFARYILQHRPGGRIAVLYQNDDYGKDYLRGLKDGLGAEAADMIIKEVTYEGTDPTIDSQIVTLQATGADVFLDVTTAKFAALAVRKIHDIGWRPLHLLNSISTSVSSVLVPAGLDKSVGIVSVSYSKDPTDPQFAADPAVLEWRAWMTKYYPEGDQANINNAIAYSRAMTLVAALKQCGDDISRENVMRQASNLELVLPMLLPGIKIKTAPDRFSAIHAMQLERFDGKSWEHFGGLIALD